MKNGLTRDKPSVLILTGKPVHGLPLLQKATYPTLEQDAGCFTLYALYSSSNPVGPLRPLRRRFSLDPRIDFAFLIDGEGKDILLIINSLTYGYERAWQGPAYERGSERGLHGTCSQF